MLVRYGVGYQVIGGTRFYERAEIKDALAYLTLLVNPADTVAFGRAVNSPRRGIGDTTQGRLVGYANTIGEPIWDVAAEPESVPGLGAAAVKAVGRFMSVMERLRERVEAGAGVGDVLAETLEETGYTEALQARAHDRGPGPAREPRGARGRGARVRRHRRGRRRSRSSSSSSRSSRSRTTCATRRASSR